MPKVIFKIEAPVLVQQVVAQKTQLHRQATQEPCQELTATGLTFRANRGSYRDSSQYSNGWTGATPMGWKRDVAPAHFLACICGLFSTLKTKGRQ